MSENEISRVVLDCCFRIHNALGPGLFESVYEEVLLHELAAQGLSCSRQVDVPIIYKGVKLDTGFRADLLVENKLIIELKSIETVLSVHKKQLLTYLKLSGKKLGLLINFNEVLLKNGITRIVNNL